MSEEVLETEVVVVGAGPGGYAAAFRAADLGLKTTLVDTREQPGGVCLYVGCIPSKALLHVSEVLGLAGRAREFGVHFNSPEIDLDRLRKWRQSVVGKLTEGLAQLAERRQVQYVRASASFFGSRRLRLKGSEISEVCFDNAVVATGSRPAGIPGINLQSERLMNSAAALELADVPTRLLVVGGGYIGPEVGTIYASLGSEVTLIELTGRLLPSVDRDLVRPLERRIRDFFHRVYVNTRLVEMTEIGQTIQVKLEGEVDYNIQEFDKVLYSVGRVPNSAGLGLETTSVQVDSKGFIKVDAHRRTSDEKIFAVGDVTGQPMLAHKASREGKVAAETIAGEVVTFDNLAVPAVVFTDPEVAWCGLTEREAKDQGRSVKISRFPWAASGRALTLDRTEGLTKMLFDPESEQVLGVGVVGLHAGELVAEAALAIEMGAVAEDFAATMHAHPTLSETLAEAAEAFLGQSIHIYRS